MVQVTFDSETPALLYSVAQNMCSLPKPTRIRQVCNNYPSSINTKPQEKRKYSPVQWYVITEEHFSFKFPRFRSFVLLLSAAYSCRWVWSAAGKMGTKRIGNSGRKARLSTANSNGLIRNRTLSSVQRGRLLTTFWRQKVRCIVFNHLIPIPQRITCVSIKIANQFTNGSYRWSNTTIH
jgi:hypothetical protein